MVNTASQTDATLPEWLSAHARSVSGRRLALDLLGGGLGGRGRAAVVGTLAALLLGFALLFGVLGTWIS